MKSFIKNNLANIILILLITVFSIFIIRRVYNDELSFKQDQRIKFYNLCYEEKYVKKFNDRTELNNFMTYEYVFENNEDKARYFFNPDYECERVMKSGDRYSTFYLYNSVISDKKMSYFLFFVIPLFVLLAVSYDLFKYYKDKDFMKVLKKDYKKNINKLILNSHKVIISMLISLFIIFLICFILTGRFYSTVGFSEDVIASLSSVSMWLIYISIISLTIGVYANIAVSTSSINDNFVVSSIESYIFYIIIWLGLIVPLYNLLISGEFIIDRLYYVYSIPKMNEYAPALLVFMVVLYLVSFALMYAVTGRKELILKKNNN